MTENTVKNTRNWLKIVFAVIFIILLILSLSKYFSQKSEKIQKKPKVQIINITESTNNIFFETQGNLQHISEIKNLEYNQISDIDKEIGVAQISVNENQKKFDTKKLNYENNIELIKFFENEILNNATTTNKNYLENVEKVLNFVNSIITKNDNYDTFSNIFSVKNPSAKDELRNLYTLTKNQYELSNPNNINIENIIIKFNKTKNLLNLTKDLLDKTSSALQFSISSVDFSEEYLAELINNNITYEKLINENLLELQKNINEINETIENNNEELEEKKNVLRLAKLELEKSKLTLTNLEQNKIFALWYEKNNQFSKKLIISISSEYLNYLKVGEKIILNENIVGILHSTTQKDNKSLEIEIYTNTEKIETEFGNIICLKIYIDRYLKENNFYILPIEAIDFEKEKAKIKIVEDNKVVIKEIQYENIINDKIIINSGLSEGDQVIIKGEQILKNGLEVEIEAY